MLMSGLGYDLQSLALPIVFWQRVQFLTFKSYE